MSPVLWLCAVLHGIIGNVSSQLLAWPTYNVVYNVYFHPLAKFPGPKLWAASRLPWLFCLLQGKLHRKLLELHKQYGQGGVIRMAPDELSFNDPQAWNDIYGHRNTRAFVKDPASYQSPPGTMAISIITANDADHSRFRRLLSHAFSEKALHEQQPLIISYVESLIAKLRERLGKTEDIMRWYNYTTFDLIGDLAFGEPFGCLERSDYHPWVALIFESVKVAICFRGLLRYVPSSIVTSIIPKSALKKRADHLALTESKVKRRLELDTPRPDFISYILRHNDEKGMTEPEIQSNAEILILAGSETTATALTGTTYWLLRRPEAMKKLVDEIRGTFTTEEDMNIKALAECTYLNAVLKEGMRMYPPVVSSLPRRVVAGSANVLGHELPYNTCVGIPHWVNYHSPLNFKNPDEFNPARWIDLDPDERLGSLQPFSTGPRNCIGQNLAWVEMRLILARVIFNFDLELPVDGFDPQQQKAYGLWDKPALNVRLSERGTRF